MQIAVVVSVTAYDIKRLSVPNFAAPTLDLGMVPLQQKCRSEPPLRTETCRHMLAVARKRPGLREYECSHCQHRWLEVDQR